MNPGPSSIDRLGRDWRQVPGTGWLIGLYVLAGALNLWAESRDWLVGIWVTKPLLLSILSLAFWRAAPPGRLRRSILLGLGFSWLGDVLLMMNLASQLAFIPWFVLGLASFLLAHLAYTATFWQLRQGAWGWVEKSWWLALPMVLYAGLLLLMLWPGLGQMALPVVIYAAVISLMAISALNLGTLLPRRVWQMLLVGVLLFVVSDSLIAWNKFRFSLGAGRLLIMFTYLLAQYAIARSMISALYLDQRLAARRAADDAPV